MDFALTSSALFRPFLARARIDRLCSVPGRRIFTESERRFFLTQHGSHSSSYFHLQPGVHYFDMPGVGFLSYFSYDGILGHQDLVFTNPACAEQSQGLLFDAFLRERGRAPIVCGVDAACARTLEARGFAVNQLGVEFNVELPTFRVTGRSMRYLRTVQHYGERGVEVKELPWSQVDREQVALISKSWLGQKALKTRELKLLSRPPEWGDAWGVRKFYAFLEGRLVAYVFFDPFFRNGRVIGYCANILRSLPDLPLKGMLDFIVLEAIKRFREEGVETLALGLAPCYDVQSQLNERGALRLILQQLYRRGSFLYSFQELAFHKTRWRGAEQRIYACLRGSSTFSDVRAAVVALRSMNVL